MNEITTLLAGIAIGIGLSFLWLVVRIKQVIDKIDSAIERAADDIMLGINVEKHGTTYRFYKEDGQFIMQTDTLDGLSKEFHNRFPTKTCYIEGGDPEAVMEIKQALGKK